ncbi:MAG: hypothetical protein ACRDHN_03470, partial [Thermomicrobiales bacterium]
MKLGFLTNSIDDIAKAARLGFDGLELHSNAFGNAAEGPLDRDLIAKTRDLCAETGVTITALAYYDIAFRTPAPDKIADAYDRVFDAAT